MSEQNTPEIPRRRRLNAEPAPNRAPAENSGTSEFDRLGIPHQPIPVRTGKKRRKLSLFSRFWFSLSPLIRGILIVLAAVIFLLFSVSVTKTYLAHQEERRRLEQEAAERASHPLYYPDWITSYSEARGLDPALVSSIILCESSFDPKAESRLGARGLMQLMEDTAAWIAHKLDEDGLGYSFDLLYDPETNIRFGTWYLGYLSNRFGGDVKKIICAYHAGQGNVDAWMQNPKCSSDGVTLEYIPTPDTSSYYDRVSGAIEIYKKYYFPAPEEEQT